MASGLLEHYQHENEMEFLGRLQSLDAGIHHYEDPHVQEKALSLVPVSELKQKAKEVCEKSKEDGQDGVDERDCLYLQIVAWFHGTFFHWKDKPVCADCGTKTERTGLVPPTDEERRWEAGKVEAYKCPNCGKDERYPRYNHPEKLLETRCGRCGEFANCHALILRSMGFEVRHVTDWTDHVWVEVYSDSQQRWLRGDDDGHLNYEQSREKKLTYIIAFSKEQVVDVTWSYSMKHHEIIQRRLQVREEWLARTLESFNEQRQRCLSPERRKVLQERFVRELAEFLSVYEGKLFGNPSWRRLIGKPVSRHDPYTFVPTAGEINTKIFRVRYCCASDKYYRGSNAEAFLEGWKSGAAEVISLFRKYEYDWTTICRCLLQQGVKEDDLTALQKGNAYLARLQCCPSGQIAWQMDFTSSGLVIDSVTITARVTTTETAKVDWKLEGDDENTQNLPLSSAQECLTAAALRGSKSLKLTATLSGGKGDVAWQQAQLFTQPIDSKNDFTFDVTVTLRDP